MITKKFANAKSVFSIKNIKTTIDICKCVSLFFLYSIIISRREVVSNVRYLLPVRGVSMVGRPVPESTRQTASSNARAQCRQSILRPPYCPFGDKRQSVPFGTEEENAPQTSSSLTIRTKQRRGRRGSLQLRKVSYIKLAKNLFRVPNKRGEMALGIVYSKTPFEPVIEKILAVTYIVSFFSVW